MLFLIQQWEVFISLLRGAYKDLLPIFIVILIFQLGVFENIPDGWQTTLIGLAIVGMGLAMFLQGLELGIFPLGESLSNQFSQRNSLMLMVIFGFLVGYGSAIAEPALSIIADKAMLVSHGKLDSFLLRQVVAIAAGLGVATGVYRIIMGHPIQYYIICGYIIALLITYFTPSEIVGLSYDLGGVTTSTVTVPLVASIGIGLATFTKGRNPIADGFGLIAFAAMMPVILVQVYGIIAYRIGVTHLEAVEVAQAVTLDSGKNLTLDFMEALQLIWESLLDIMPVLAIVGFFHFVILRKAIHNLRVVLLGIVLMLLGLSAFSIGLQLGLFSLGETMAMQLADQESRLSIYFFAFAIGFATTMAEPALMTISHRAKMISEGKIGDYSLRVFVAIGVATGIALGSYRIVNGHSIHIYVIVGYALVVLLTYFAPKYIIAIAYDSGGVTTSTITVPLVAALGLGLSSTIPGRDPLVDGFGLIAFASLFPMLTVLIYGFVVEHIKLPEIEQEVARFPAMKNNPSKAVTVEQAKRNVTPLEQADVVGAIKSDVVNPGVYQSFTAIVVIVDSIDMHEAILAAKEMGAGGVTMIDATGFGIGEFDSGFRYLKNLRHKTLLFLVPESIVNTVIENIKKHLHLNRKSEQMHGLVFSIPIENLQGISLRQQNLYQAE